MDEFGGGGGGGGSAIGAIIFMGLAAIILLALYVFVCISMKKICEKAGKDPGIMIWIPIVQYIPLMEVAGMQTWMIVLLFLPIANLIFIIMLLLGLAKARNKPVFMPIVLWLFCLGPVGAFGYLGFTE